MCTLLLTGCRRRLFIVFVAAAAALRSASPQPLPKRPFRRTGGRDKLRLRRLLSGRYHGGSRRRHGSGGGAGTCASSRDALRRGRGHRCRRWRRGAVCTLLLTGCRRRLFIVFVAAAAALRSAQTLHDLFQRNVIPGHLPNLLPGRTVGPLGLRPIDSGQEAPGRFQRPNLSHELPGDLALGLATFRRHVVHLPPRHDGAEQYVAGILVARRAPSAAYVVRCEVGDVKTLARPGRGGGGP